MKSTIATMFCWVLLAGCATVGHDVAFDGANGKAFVMVVSKDIQSPFPTYTSYGFRRVDMSKSVFLSDSFETRLDIGSLEGGSEFEKANQSATPLRFSGTLAVSAEYAFVYRSQTSTMATGRSNTVILCNSRGAAIYRLTPGRINVLAAADVGVSRATVELQLKEILQNYPNMTAPIEFAEAVGIATYPDAPKHGNKKSCGSSGSFSLIRAM